MAASRPLAVVPPSFWEGLSTYDFLNSVAADGVEATPDLSLVGSLPEIGKYTYFLNLEPGQAYRLAGNSLSGQSQMLLTNTATGEILWGNASALASVHVDPAEAYRTITVDQTLSVTLTVFSIPGGPPESFNLELFANAAPSKEPQLPEEPKPPEPNPPLEPPPLTDDGIYRYVKASSNSYFYTASAAERELLTTAAPDFRLEGPVFVGDDVAREGYVPVYRFVNKESGSYFYTASEAERLAIETTQPIMRFEGAGFYVPATPTEETVTVYRLQNTETGGYLFTANLVEKAYALLKGGWRDEGAAFEAFPVGYVTPQAQEHVAEASLDVQASYAPEVPLLGQASFAPPGLELFT